MRKNRIFFALLMAALLLSGCAVRTVDEMYCLPKRSETYNDLQSAIDSAMSGLEYCAPLSGEQRQTVQMADVDGDAKQEYLLFAKGGSERPLKILVFDEVEESIVLTDTIELTGSAFDKVEYVQMDGKSGLELVVGCQVSDQILRCVSVYTFNSGESEQLLSTNYTRFLSVNLNADLLTELFVLRPGQEDSDRGIVELYTVEKETVSRSIEVSMSESVDNLKRIRTGKLHDGNPAVYVASAVGDTALITDVYALVDGVFTNVTLSNESGTSVKTMRNYYVYADDIDSDGVIELPFLITMVPVTDARSDQRHDLIRWYAMTSDGGEVDKLYTYHNFNSGWYLELDSQWAPRLAVKQEGSDYAFYLWDEAYENAEKIMTVYTLSGQNRTQQGTADGGFILLSTESIVYAAKLEAAAEGYGIDQNTVKRSFKLIHEDWKTGET